MEGGRSSTTKIATLFDSDRTCETYLQPNLEMEIGIFKINMKFENFCKYLIICKNSLFQTLKNSNYSGKAIALLIEKRMISSKQKFLLDFYYL